MKKRAGALLCAGLLLGMASFFCLWQKERADQSVYLQMGSAGVQGALTALEDYRKSGQESDYIYLAGDFNLFVKACFLMREDMTPNKNRLPCNELYGYMAVAPERLRGHLDELEAVLSMLSADLGDPNAYLRMAELCNAIAREA